VEEVGLLLGEGEDTTRPGTRSLAEMVARFTAVVFEVLPERAFDRFVSFSSLCERGVDRGGLTRRLEILGTTAVIPIGEEEVEEEEEVEGLH